MAKHLDSSVCKYLKLSDSYIHRTKGKAPFQNLLADLI